VRNDAGRAVLDAALARMNADELASKAGGEGG
jgi:hypothetical protein